MLKTLKKFFAFCGVDNRRLFITSIWLGVVSAICSAMRIPAAAIVIQALLERNVTMATLWTSLGIIVISLIITIAINMKATMLQTRAGYRACANKRIEIAEHLRYLPMGWFNDNSLGGRSRPFPSGSSMPMSALCPRCWNMCRASPRSRIST